MEAKRAFSGLLDITAFPQDGVLTEPDNAEMLEKALEMGADNVGMIPHNEREDGVKSVEAALDLAVKYTDWMIMWTRRTIPIPDF